MPAAALADWHDDKPEVGQATPAPGDEPAFQGRCRAVVFVGADQAPALLLEADRGLLDGDLDEGCAPP